jgi:hypothetical protein
MPVPIDRNTPVIPNPPHNNPVVPKPFQKYPIVNYYTASGVKQFNISKPLYQQIMAMKLAADQTGNPLVPGIEYLGKGYNIFGTYARPDQVLPASIYSFDQSLLVKMNMAVGGTYYLTLPFIDVLPLNGVDYYSIIGSSGRQLQENMEIQAGIQGSYSLFSADCNIGRNSNQLKDYSYSFANSVLRVLKWKLQLRIDGLKQHLDATFKSQLAQIGATIPSSYQPGRTPFTSDCDILNQFFGTYGVFFVTGIYVGGIVSAKSTVDNYIYVDQNNLKVDASAGLLSLINCDVSYEKSTTLSTYKSASTIYRDVFGGDASKAVRLCSPDVTIDDYQQWVASVSGKNTDNQCIQTMIDFVEASPGGNLPLAGIWLLSDDLRISNYIKDYFTEFYAPRYGIPIDGDGSYRRNIPYKITVKTCDVDSAGTDATITISLRGTRSVKSPDQVMNIMGQKIVIPGNFMTYIQLPNSPDYFERGDTNIFSYPDIPEIPDLGDITQLHVTHDNRGDKPGWKVEYIEISYENKSWRFGSNIWIAVDEPGGNSQDLRRIS